jgi:hypothetical protein
VRRLAPVVVAAVVVLGVLGLYLVLGGASFEPTPVADPCAPRAQGATDGIDEAIERVALTALDGAACDLGVSRESLVLALREGLLRAIDEAEEDGTLPGFAAGLVRAAAERVPPRLLLELVEQLRGLVS